MSTPILIMAVLCALSGVGTGYCWRMRQEAVAELNQQRHHPAQTDAAQTDATQTDATQTNATQTTRTTGGTR